MSENELGKVAALISAAYRINFDDFTIKVWHEVLKDLDYEIVQDVVKNLLNSEFNSFNINPARIRIEYKKSASKKRFREIQRMQDELLDKELLEFEKSNGRLQLGLGGAE